jgi:Flp pilus assembly protein TadD
LGISYAVQGETQKAYEMFQRATKLEPNNTTYSADVMRAMQDLGMMGKPKPPQ